MVQIQLLIVHTQPLIVAGIHALVAHLRHWQVVGQTTQAFDALRFVQNHAVDVVLTEQRLPGLSGVALCAALRKHDADVSLGIIGDLTAAEETIALAHGVGIFLTPQVTQRDLGVLAHRLRHHTARRALFYHAPTQCEALSSGAKHITQRTAAHHELLLSNRERDVIVLLSHGANNVQIAAALTISVHTVKQHISSAMRKCCIHTRHELVRFAARQGWLT